MEVGIFWNKIFDATNFAGTNEISLFQAIILKPKGGVTISYRQFIAE